MREASASCFLSVGCREGPRGLDVRGEIGGLGFDEYVLFLIYTERDWFCFEIVLTELHEFRRIDHFLIHNSFSTIVAIATDFISEDQVLSL